MIRLAIILALGLVSCASSRAEIETLLNENLSGTLNAQPWQFVYGYTDPEARLPEGQAHMIVLLATRPKINCPDEKTPLTDTRAVVFTIPAKPTLLGIGKKALAKKSEYGFDGDPLERVAQGAMAFSFGTKPKRAMKSASTGLIKITSITSTQIRGQIFGKIDAQNYVNGQFIARVCQYGQIN